MKIARYILPTVILTLSASFTARSQDLNPTVEVSRQYQGRLSDIDKPSVEMAVPDSVLKFNLKFDYSVFDNPYRGSYEFRPFLSDMDLAPRESGERKFYLLVGAGYPLHPVLDFVWSPLCGNKFKMSVFARHQSYIGRYSAIGLRSNTLKDSGLRYSGHDLVTEAGVDGAYDWGNGVFDFKASYFGTALKDSTLSRGYDGLDLKLGLSSKDRSTGRFVYDVQAAYRYGKDKVSYSRMSHRTDLVEHNFSLFTNFGSMFKEKHSLFFDLGADVAAYSGTYGGVGANMKFTPHYIFRNERWNVDLGLKISILLRNNNTQNLLPLNNTAPGQIFYPDIRVSYTFVKKYLDMYLAVDGGTDINSYSSLLSRNRHISPLYNNAYNDRYGLGTLIDNTIERVSTALGIEGNLASRFQYDLSVGYRNFANAPLESVFYMDDAGTPYLSPALGYTPLQMFFARLDCGWKSEDVEVGCELKYVATDLMHRSATVLAPPAFSGYVDAVYNWKGRIYAGVDLGFATVRKGYFKTPAQAQRSVARVPGYADLGLSLGYSFTRKFTLWLHGGNLLNMTVQKTPLYAESGIYFNAGICLNF